jgi:hypothetical protein
VNPPRPINLDVDRLANLFCRTTDCLGQFEEADAAWLPERFRQLLDHHAHMTVTQEAAHGCPVEVEVLDRQITETHYARKSLLRRTSDHQVVQYCTVRLNFEYLGPQVRQSVEDEAIPLGRILIHHNVLRQVQMVALWKIRTGGELRKYFQLAEPTVTYGRTALIYCDGDPAVELLEIIAP